MVEEKRLSHDSKKKLTSVVQKTNDGSHQFALQYIDHWGVCGSHKDEENQMGSRFLIALRAVPTQSSLTSPCPIMMKSPPTLLLRFQAFPKSDILLSPARNMSGHSQTATSEPAVGKQRQYWFIGKMIQISMMTTLWPNCLFVNVFPVYSLYN